MVLLGGVQTLAGPVVGAVTFTWLQDAVARNTDYWRALLGGIILCWCWCSRRASPASCGSCSIERRRAPTQRSARVKRMSLLKVTDLGKSFGGYRAVDDVSFELAAGELLALIGPNGAGKSTTFNMVNGQLRADGGSIRLDGQELIGRKPREIWRMGVGRTFQIAETFASLTVVENVQMALLSARRASCSRCGAARPRTSATRRWRCSSRSAWRRRPTGRAACWPTATSSASSWRSRWPTRPKLLLMDEPTAGMAPKERNELMALTKRLVSERGLAVLFTEHSMDVVFAYADRMIVLARGRLIAAGQAGRDPRPPEGAGGVLRQRQDLREDARRAVSGMSTDEHHERLLEAHGLTAWYGAAQILFDVASRCGAARWWR